MAQSDISHGFPEAPLFGHERAFSGFAVGSSRVFTATTKRRLSWSMALRGGKATFFMGKGDVFHGPAGGKATFLLV
jgi:hypothetical protein